MRKHIPAEEIVRLLMEPSENRIPLRLKLEKEALIRDLAQALQISKHPLTSCILCGIIGDRYKHAKSAVPVLLERLEDEDWEVRNFAAEALSKISSISNISNPTIDKRILEHFRKEPIFWLSYTLGDVKNKEAIPDLSKSLTGRSEWLRGASAWALANMHAVEAKNKIFEALQKETDEWAANHMKKALEELEKN